MPSEDADRRWLIIYDDVPWLPPFDGLLRDHVTKKPTLMPNFLSLLWWTFLMHLVLGVVVLFFDERVTHYLPEFVFLNQHEGAGVVTRALGVMEFGLSLTLKAATYMCMAFCTALLANRKLKLVDLTYREPNAASVAETVPDCNLEFAHH